MKKILIIAFLIIIVQTLRAGYYISAETCIFLNGVWQFKTDHKQISEVEKLNTTDYNDKSWDKIDVPGSCELHYEYTNCNGNTWYKTIFKTSQMKNKHLFLEVGAGNMIWSGNQNIFIYAPVKKVFSYLKSYEVAEKKCDKVINQSEIEYITLHTSNKKELQNIELTTFPTLIK